MPPAEDPSVSARIAGIIARSLSAAGGDGPALLQRHGVTLALVDDADGELGLSVEQRLWEEAATLSGDPSFGLSTLERIETAPFAVLDHAVRTSPTVRGAVEALSRYLRVLPGGAEISLDVLRDEACITHHLPGRPDGGGWQRSLFTVASWLHVGRFITGIPWEPREAWFQQAAPAALDEVEAFFGAPLRFQQPVDALTFDAELLDLPVDASESPLASRLRHHDERLAAAPTGSAVIDDLRRALPAALRAGETTAEEVAVRLRQDGRRVQRGLKEAGRSFKEVLDEVRRALALSLLEEDDLAITDVAYLLGYADGASLPRAFKRWTGTSPAAWRADRERAISRPAPEP